MYINTHNTALGLTTTSTNTGQVLNCKFERKCYGFNAIIFDRNSLTQDILVFLYIATFLNCKKTAVNRIMHISRGQYFGTCMNSTIVMTNSKKCNNTKNIDEFSEIIKL